MLRKILKNVQRPLIDFPNLKKSRKPSTYLMAPEGFCTYEPAQISPVFDVSAADLAAAFEALILGKPNTEKLSETPIDGDRQMDYVQYSKTIGFPDTITIRFMEVEENRSTMAIYSRSHYGYRDFGVNRKRIVEWMKLLTAQVS